MEAGEEQAALQRLDALFEGQTVKELNQLNAELAAEYGYDECARESTD